MTSSTDSTDSTESDPAARHLDEEPQQERGEPGSRDADSGTGGSTDRPVGTSDADDQTGVDPQDSDTGSPNMQSGDGG